jgi:peptide/nickel transport system substrate-binding protein
VRRIVLNQWLAALGLAALASCTSAPDSPARAPRPNRVTIGVRADAGTFNLYTATNSFAQEIADLLFLRLADEQDDFAKGPPTLRPALARSWEFSPDGTELTMKLDPGARWSDGTPITSADVAFSYRAAKSPDVGWAGSDVKDLIADVRAPDPNTVVFKFSRVYPYRLLDAAEGNVIPEHVWGSLPFAEWPKAAFLTAPAVSGPFRLVRYEPASTIELARNPAFVGAPLPRLDGVVFRILPDVETLVNELLAGGIDVLPNLPEEAAARVRANPQLTVVRSPDLSYTFICWNTSRAPFSDPRVRRALTLAIDRKAIIATLVPETGKPSTGPIPSALWAYEPDVERLDFDPAMAGKLLDEAGFTDSNGDGLRDRGGKPFRFELETNQGSAIRGHVLEMVVAQLGRVGVEAVPRTYEFGASVRKHEQHGFDAFVGGWRESTKVDLKSVLHSSARTNGYNYGLYSNPELDALIDRAREESDPAAARALWSRVQRIVAHDQPLTFLFEADRLHGIRKGLKGFHPGPRSAYSGMEAWTWEGTP